MNLILSALLAVPAAPMAPTPNPAKPFDGSWTIVSLEYNGKKLNSNTGVNIADGRLVFKPGNAGPALTLELAGNHVAWLWAGPNKMVWVPGTESYYYIGNILYRDPRYEVRDLTPGHWETVAQKGIHLELGGLHYLVFGAGEDGPSLTLTLRRETNTPTATQPQH